MTTLNPKSRIEKKKILIRSNGGKMIRYTKIHDPGHSVRTGWVTTGEAMTKALKNFSQTQP